jgi:hypothetical protein
MQTPYNDPTISWPHPLFTRRTVGTSCDVAFDFTWADVIGHNYANFRGLQDLSQTISQFSRTRGKTPLLLLSDKAGTAFRQLVTDSKYVAVVNIRDFLVSSKEHDRSALFFLNAISNYDNVSAPSVGPVTSIGDQQLLEALKVVLNGRRDVLIDLVNKGGSELTLALFDAAVKGLEKNESRGDLEALTNIFSSSSAGVISDAAIAAKRRAAVDEFEHLLGEDAIEQEFQTWFQANAWVLGSDCVLILDERRIDLDNIADFLVKGYDGRADVIELKRPGARFWQSEKDHDNYIPHRDLVKAIIQAQKYQFALEGKISDFPTQKRLGVPIAKPSALLIHGRSCDWDDDQFEAQRLLNAGFTNLNVITYDQVLRRAKIVIGSNL